MESNIVNFIGLKKYQENMNTVVVKPGIPMESQMMRLDSIRPTLACSGFFAFFCFLTNSQRPPTAAEAPN